MMKVSLPGLFHEIALRCPECRLILDELQQHLRETIRGEHTLQEFAEHYCLAEASTLKTQERAP